MGWFDFVKGKKEVELGSTSANQQRPVQSTHRRKSVANEISGWPDECSDDLQIMLSNGMDPKVPGQNGISALHWSAARGYAYVTNSLIDEGLDINCRMPFLEKDLKLCDGSTPLHLAAANGAAEVARVLLSRGANPLLTNDHGDTPLHLAVGVSEKIATLLLQRGANVRCRDRRGYSPLHWAAYPMRTDRWGDYRNRAGYVYGWRGAIRYDPVKLVQVFLDAGLSPRETLNKVQTP